MNYLMHHTHKTTLLMVLITTFSALFHYYNLTWGSPFHFHPDERNIASAVAQLSFPNQLNPHFFAYGSLPIYCIFALGLMANSIIGQQTATVSFEQAIFISRILSASFATLLIPLLFIVGTKIRDTKTGLLAAIFATVSTGIIQFAHFGTFEMWITFFTLVLFLFCIDIFKNKQHYSLFLAAVICGILVSIKITSIVLLPLPLLAYGFTHWKKKRSSQKTLMHIGNFILFIGICCGVYLFTNPFVILTPNEFISSIQYESNVAFNKLPVFYTQTFYDTVPLLYQITHVFPFLLNPFMTILGLLSLIFFSVTSIKKPHAPIIFLLLFTYILVFSQAFLFIKWTRYMVPTLPFFYLLTSLMLVTTTKYTKPLFLGILLTINIVFGLSYFKTVFLEPDTRIASYTFTKNLIPQTAQVLSEVYDLGIIPFNQTYPHITLFNTYDTDTSSPESNKAMWDKRIEQADYIILPSQRVLQTRLTNPTRYPKGNDIYSQLFSGAAGFTKIYETPCDIFCQITYLGDPINRFEQTASVFDRPTIFIFRKTLYK